ncbi:Smr/MutS family protein [Halothiobacillus sp. DCM-1]|uniref:Smr/MutS family protein n=1 Tax=Halothiobacillus sp. DCM-1 TaxID=3112558 RepID=UPI003252540D
MPKRPVPPLNDEDIALFRDTIGCVDPLTVDFLPPEGPSRSHRRILETAHFSDADINPLSDAGAEPIEQGEFLSYLRPDTAPNILRKLKRGQFSVVASLDLHGMTVDAARSAIHRFFQAERQEIRCCVRLVHGKGNRSERQIPVLKQMVNHWLPQRDDVVAFCSAPPHDGGTGALYVLLKRR